MPPPLTPTLSPQAGRGGRRGQHVGREAVDRVGRGVPGAHEAAAGLAEEGVEAPAALAQARLHRRAAARRTRRSTAPAPSGARPRGRRCARHSRCAMALAWRAFSQPHVVLEQRQPRRRDEPHLGVEVARLLDPPLELPRQLAIEEQHGLADREPVLDPAEAQHVDAGAPGQIGRRAAEDAPAHWQSARRPCAP